MNLRADMLTEQTIKTTSAFHCTVSWSSKEQELAPFYKLEQSWYVQEVKCWKSHEGKHKLQQQMPHLYHQKLLSVIHPQLEILWTIHLSAQKWEILGSQIKKIMHNKNEVTLATDIGCLDHTNCKRKRGSIALIICCSKSGLRAFSIGSSPTAISSSPRVESTVQYHKYVSVTLWKKQWWVKINYRYLGKEYNLGTKSLKNKQVQLRKRVLRYFETYILFHFFFLVFESEGVPPAEVLQQLQSL